MKAIIISFQLALIVCFWPIQKGICQIDQYAEYIENQVIEIDEKGWSPGGVVFTGSSSIRLWKTLNEDFSEMEVLNTGFGGAQTHQVLFHLNDVILRYEPSKVIVYVGENDIWAEKPVRQIIEEYIELVIRVKANFPNSKIYFIGTKPSPSRIKLRGQMELLNEQLANFCQNSEELQYIDVWEAMLDQNGDFRSDLFVEDQLHMNEKGYEIWKDLVRKAIE